MWQADTNNYHQGDYISASMLAGSGCARQVQFERLYDFYDLPEKRYWPFRGTHAHQIVENAGEQIAKYGWLQEIRMSCELVYPDEPRPLFDEQGQWTGEVDTTKPLVIALRGTCDAYNPVTRTLVDCKSMADRKVDMMIKGASPGTWSNNLQDSWIAQLNIYRYLITKTLIPKEIKAQFKKYGLPKLPGPLFPAPDKLVIQGIAMMTHPVSGSRLAHKERGKVTLYDIDPVPVWSLEEIEEYIRPRALEWYGTLALRKVPPVVPKEKAWLCRNCHAYGKRCFPEQERAAQEETS
jgi:hypothetical protein